KLPAELADLIEDLYDTMDAANGVGLAANQIGISQRVFVYDCADERGLSSRRRGVIVNPVLETSEVPETMPDPDNDDEGCLSVPGESFPTGRRRLRPTPCWSSGYAGCGPAARRRGRRAASAST
ncbi:MAG: peptide deformylase, partial [Mycobacterium sp.]|nr:peptide deformylase [Mycobacterium sp.]